MSQPNEFRFRPFALEDVPVLGAWLEGAGLGVEGLLARSDWGQRVIRDPRILCRAAIATGSVTRTGAADAVVGYFRLDLAPDRSAEVTLIVHPLHRRGGIGGALLAAALTEARRVGLRRMLAVIHDHNDGALEFFEKAGFEPAGVVMPGFVHLARMVHRSDHQPPLEIVV